MTIISKVDLVSDDLFKEYVLTSNTLNEISMKIGYRKNQTTKGKVLIRIKELGLITKHFKNWNTLGSVPTIELLKIDTNRDNQTIKKRLIKENLIPYVCAHCGIGSHYNNKKLVLHMDHENGLSNDNRLENLRFLCPNCHSQTDTYSGKNNRGRKNKS